MDIFNFCWMTVLNESNKCHIFFDKNTCKVKNNIDQNFTRPVSRIAYLYRFGSYNISFFYQCFKEFFTNVPDSSKIIDDFRAIKNLTICSMSTGPGTDIIGLLYSLHLVEKPLVNSTTFRIVSKDGNWRNLVTEMINSSIIRVPEESACYLIGCNFLTKLSIKAKNYLKAADILLMSDSFSSSVISEQKICNTLKMTIELLKPGVLVFLIFSEEKSTYFKELDNYGSFLYGPVEVTLEDMPYNEEIAELVGVKPLSSGTSIFAVWQKFHKITSKIHVGKETENSLGIGSDQQPATELNNGEFNVMDVYSPLINGKFNVMDVYSPIQSMPNLKREFLNVGNISSRESIGSSIGFASSSISSQTIKSPDTAIFSDNLVNFNVESINDFSETSSKSSVQKVSLSASDSSLGKNNGKKEDNKGKDMNSLLKKFEALITKFEGLISSQNSYATGNQSSNCQYCNQPLHQCHYVKPCHLNEKDSTCCCHSIVCDNNINAGTHNCPLNMASDRYRILPREGPCIVIPLQNLSNESLNHILSIITQNCSSVVKTSTVCPKEEKG